MTDRQTTAATIASTTSLASRAIQITLAAMLGVLVLAGAGFAQMEAVHNAAHDYRHSMGFPCH